MTTTNTHADWIGTTVYDSSGGKLGDITDIFYDDNTGQPEWLTISTGWFGTSEQFVPIAGTSRHDDGLRVDYTEDHVKDSPSIDTDQEHIEADDERRLYEHYGLDFDAADHETAYGNRERADEGYDYSDTRDAHRTEAHGDTSVTRSEEQLSVDKTMQESGKVRLHKYVVTDDVDVTVPVKRQVARVVRTDVNDTRGGTIASDDMVEEVVLQEEQVTVDKEVVTKEEISLETDTVTDDKTVSETVRKEKVEIEGDVETS